MIYLDHLASTPLDPRVLDAMLPWMAAGAAGNPHAAHAAGWRAAEAIERARGEVAALVGARPGEVVFTSGATEANTLALLGGAASGAATSGGAVITSAVEHASVLGCLPELRRRGHAVTVLPVDRAGRVDPAALDDALRGHGAAPACPASASASAPPLALVSIMAANNEIGTIQPLAELAAVARAHGALLHSDATQAVGALAPGRTALDMAAIGLAGLSLSGHKLHGPMGIGALVARAPFQPLPPSAGGGQQRGRRPGTLPTPLCVGLGEACRLARMLREEDARRIAALRDRLWKILAAALPGLRRNGPADAADGLAGCLSVTLPGLDAADRLLDLPDLAVATGSACHSTAADPSHVLLAIGLGAEEAHASLRFGLGRGTTAQEIDRAAERLVAVLRG